MSTLPPGGRLLSLRRPSASLHPSHFASLVGPIPLTGPRVGTGSGGENRPLGGEAQTVGVPTPNFKEPSHPEHKNADFVLEKKGIGTRERGN